MEPMHGIVAVKRWIRLPEIEVDLRRNLRQDRGLYRHDRQRRIHVISKTQSKFAYGVKDLYRGANSAAVSGQVFGKGNCLHFIIRNEHGMARIRKSCQMKVKGGIFLRSIYPVDFQRDCFGQALRKINAAGQTAVGKQKLIILPLDADIFKNNILHKSNLNN